jgi:hypothetical protein
MAFQKTPPPAGGIHSYPIGRVRLDKERLNQDIATIETFQMNPAYSEYAKGEWTTCMLFNKSGDLNDGLSEEYDGSAIMTEYGSRVPYLCEMICDLFKIEHLKSARIFSAQNGFIIPHVDYLEFKRGFTRIHVVLRTNDHSLNSEGSTVYHMQEGEIWFLDGRVTHSGGSFANERRLHLVLDFNPEIPIKDLFRDPANHRPGLTPCIIKREPFGNSERNSLIVSLSGILSEINYDTVFEVVAKLHFNREMDCAETYDMMIDIARQSGKQQLLEKARSAKQYFLGGLRKAS